MLARPRLIIAIVAISLVASIVFLGIYILSANKNGGQNKSGSQQATTLPNAANTPQQSTPDQQNAIPQNTGPATATINPYSLVKNSASPTITGTYENTYQIEVILAATQLPQRSFLNDPIPNVLWDDVSDHGGGVHLTGVHSGFFTDEVTKNLPDGNYTVGIYSDVLFYPRTDENAAKEYRQLLTSGTLTIRHAQ